MVRLSPRNAYQAGQAQAQALHAGQPGYAGSLVIGEGQQLTAVSLWQTGDDAVAGLDAAGPQVQRLLQPLPASPSRLLAAGEIVASDRISRPTVDDAVTSAGSTRPATAPADVPRLASSPLRIACPSRDLAQAEAFWARGLGLQVLERVQPRAGGEHPLVMLGWPHAAWHLELVGDPEGQAPPAPTQEDLLVLYLGQPADDTLVARLVGAGGQVVPARNPYWDRWGITIADPDGYRLVLSHRTWP